MADSPHSRNRDKGLSPGVVPSPPSSSPDLLDNLRTAVTEVVRAEVSQWMHSLQAQLSTYNPTTKQLDPLGQVLGAIHWSIYTAQQDIQYLKQRAETSGQSGERDEDSRQSSQQIEALQQDVRSLSQRVEATLAAMEAKDVRAKIDVGAATSDAQREHLNNSNAYKNLVRHSLRDIANLLCPAGGPRAKLAERRAEAASELLYYLFEDRPEDGEVAAESIRARLTKNGFATQGKEFGPQLEDLMRRASKIRQDMTSSRPAARLLSFGDDPADLAEGEYEVWNPGPGGRPAILIAPAYVVDGIRQQRLRPPVVFLKAPANGEPDGVVQ